MNDELDGLNRMEADEAGIGMGEIRSNKQTQAYELDFEKIRQAPPEARWNIMMDIFEMLGMAFWLPLDDPRCDELAERFKAKGMLKPTDAF